MSRVLFQHGLYPREKYKAELNWFLEDAERMVYNAIKGGDDICYRELVEEMGKEETDKKLFNEVQNYKMMWCCGSTTAKIFSDLILLSKELYYAKSLPLKQKILLFDKVIHTIHEAGAFLD